YVSVEQTREAAAMVLLEIQPPGSMILSVATNALAGTNWLDRIFGTFLLGTILDHREVAAPWLARNLQSTDVTMVVVSLRSIEHLGMPMAGLVPDMIQLLTNQKGPAPDWMLWYSCKALTALGSNSAPAIPILKQQFLQCTNCYQRPLVAA